MLCISLETPIGKISLTEKTGNIKSLRWESCHLNIKTTLLSTAARQLHNYFQGKVTCFSLPISPEGTIFQKAVWKVLLEIPYGKQITYKQLSNIVGTSPRSVGQACKQNPIPIIIPCHRVTLSSGKPGKYSGGEGEVTKRFLLDLEQNLP